MTVCRLSDCSDSQNICMKKNIRILHIAKKTFLLHSLTSYLGPIFLAIRSIHLQMREANLPVSYLEPVFYYPYSLPLLRVNRELENSVSMVMWAWYPGSVFSIRSSASCFSCFRLHPYWRVMSAYTHLFFFIYIDAMEIEAFAVPFFEFVEYFDYGF